MQADPSGPVRRVWTELGSPEQAELNNITIRLEQRGAEFANDNARVYYVQSLGLMQNVFGYPEPAEGFGRGFAAYSVPFPGQQPPE